MSRYFVVKWVALLLWLCIFLFLVIGLYDAATTRAQAIQLQEEHAHACRTGDGRGWSHRTTHTHDMDNRVGRPHIPGTTLVSYNEDHLDHRCGEPVPSPVPPVVLPVASPVPPVVLPVASPVPPVVLPVASPVPPVVLPVASPVPPVATPKPRPSSSSQGSSDNESAAGGVAPRTAEVVGEKPTPGICSSYPHAYIRDASLGQTYRVIARDGCVYRRWIHPDSPVVYSVPWPQVNADLTFPVADVLSIPLDAVQPWEPSNPTSHMLVRRFDGSDDRIFVHVGGQWAHVPDLATFVARGYRWQDVCAADADFWVGIVE